MIYTDGVHLAADTPAELHAFAQSIGLNREWFQDHPRHPHYDLTTARMRQKAIDAGAVEMSARAIILLLRLAHQTEQERRRQLEGEP